MLRQGLVVLRHDKKIIPLLIILVTASQALQNIPQAWTPDSFPDYKIFIVPYIDNCSLTHYPQRDGYTLLSDNVTAIHDGKYKDTRDPLKWYVNCLSYKLTQSPSFIPILFSIGLIPLVYLLTIELTKDRLIGLIAVTAFIPNPLYSQWVTSATYDQTWSFFLMLSVYLMFRLKGIQYGIPGLIASLAAKGLGVLYMPVWMYSLWKTGSTQRNKLMGLGILFLIFGIASLVMVHKANPVGADIGFFPEHLQDGLLRNFSMLYDVVPILLGLVIVQKAIKPKIKIQNKGLVILWMVSAFLTTPMIYLFTNQFQFVYRFVPLAVFMSIFIGITAVELGNYIVELKLKTNKPDYSIKES